MLIHGDYTHIGIFNDIKNEDIADILLNLYINNYSDFLNTLDFIGGRFTIIVKHKNDVYLYPDATNGRSNYYLSKKVVVSSHAKLLANTFNISREDKEFTFGNILLETPFVGVKSVIPNHYVHLNTAEVVRFFPRRNNQFKQMSEKKKLELVEKFWKKQIEFYSSKENNVIFSITGGLDSRFSLSLAKKHMYDFDFFTYALTSKIDNSTSTSKMLSKDYAIVSQILHDFKLNHNFFFFNDNPIELTNDENATLRENTISPHHLQLVKYVYNTFGGDLIHLRGNLLEIGQAYLHRREKVPSNMEIAKEAFLKTYADQTRDLKKLEILFDDFIKNLNYLDEPFDYHMVDLIYWELRMGRWICEVSNNHDPVFRTINPFNHRAMILISLSFDYEQRRDGYMFKEIINRNFPLLNFYGINETKNLYEQSKLNQVITNKASDVKNRNFNKLYFNEFNMFDRNSLVKINTRNENEIYLPESLKEKGQYTEAILPFNKKNGITYITLKNSYGSKDLKGYIYYEVYKNNELLIKEDISNWSIPNNISIPGLVKDDEIKIRLSIYKNLTPSENWAAASSLKVLFYQEIISKMSDKRKIMFSSPYSFE